MTLKTVTIGYPRIGPNREMKKALEDYWGKKIKQDDLVAASDKIFENNLDEQVKAGIDIIGVGHHTMYDPMADWTLRFGLLAPRFQPLVGTMSRLDLFFSMARGVGDVTALDMTKWYDTNYHNLVPEIDPSTTPKKDWADYIEMIKKAVAKIGGDKVGAEIIGPITVVDKASLKGVTLDQVVDKLIPLYIDLLKELKALGVAEVQINEPALILDKAKDLRSTYERVFTQLATVGVPINLITFYDDIGEAYPWAVKLPGVTAVSLDFTRGDTMSLLKKHGFPQGRRLGAGVVDGRSVWKDVSLASKMLKEIKDTVGPNVEVSVQPSSSLQHVPYDVENETKVDASLKARLSFARQKLQDVKAVATAAPGTAKGGVEFAVQDADVKEPPADMINRSKPFTERRSLQMATLGNVKLPTSTIGSFPQTPAMRKIRLKYRKGEVSSEEYQRAVDQYIAYCIGVQEGLGLDVLVHGEPERSDMVEYFGERMDGFLFTQLGWVQSYGSRYVRPPIIHGDVARTGNQPMTVREFIVAQDCTTKPVKGMLTGPVTILNWSFPRKDIARKEQAFQIGYALRDEVADLEAAGCCVIQVDEPALREGLPIKPARWAAYLDWAVKAFRLSTTVCKPELHVVTHFCYSEFEDVMQAIKDLDADQITIENSRSDDAVLKYLVEQGYDHDVAPGIYDVHSPVIPPTDKLMERVEMIKKSGLEFDRIWIVPDCGLKTRKWDEVIESLRNLVTATKSIRG